MISRIINNQKQRLYDTYSTFITLGTMFSKLFVSSSYLCVKLGQIKGNVKVVTAKESTLLHILCMETLGRKLNSNIRVSLLIRQVN